MRFGIIGLGKIGGNLARRAMERGHQVAGYDREPELVRALAREGVIAASSLEDLAAHLVPPRFALLYLPHGTPTEETCRALGGVFAEGDVVADGGNSHWADSQRRHEMLAASRVRFLDVGTSGGVSGARQGACFMVGGDRGAYDAVAPVLRDLAVDDQAVFYAGPSGSGHFVKLVHNAIEFGMVQAIAEGVELLERWEHPLDLEGLFGNWMHGSVIRGWLVELMRKALREGPPFDELSSYVEDTGEVKWLLEWALANDVPAPVAGMAQAMLMQYRDADSTAAKAVALMRNQFGGHPLHRVSQRRRRVA